MGRTIIGVAILVLALGSSQPARADFEAGQRAWDAGRPDEALTQWRAAADAGDRRAMLALGRLYVQGLGVLQDYVEAHKWLNLAASRGEVAAVEERDAVAEKMTPEERAEAQKLARAWRPVASGTGGPQDKAGDAPETVVTRATAAVPTRDEAPAPDAGPPPRRAIREAQSLLGALGYRPGPADGIWGRRTGEAYRAFLRDAGLPAAQVLTVEGLRALRTLAKRGGRGAETGPDTTAAGTARTTSEASTSRPAVRPDALHRAAKAGDINSLNAALATGVDVNALDGRGRTALMHAVNEGYTLLVQPLLEAKADVDIRAPDGATALFMAVAHGHTEIVAMLMKAGADVSVRGPKGNTAVDVARLQYGEPDAAREKGLDGAVLALVDGRTWAEVQAEIRRQKDDAAWERAQRLGTAVAYRSYVGANPEGRHVATAKRREAALTAKEERRQRLTRKWPRGKRLRDCEECPELVVIPAGTFRMGSSLVDPVHNVTISEPLAVGVYEVTREEFGHFVKETGCCFPL